MNKINIYFFGSENFFLSTIFLNSLIKFTQKNRIFELKYIINTDYRANNFIKKLFEKIKNTVILYAYFFFNKKYYIRLNLIKNIAKTYKAMSRQAKLSNIPFNDMKDFQQNKIEKKSILLCYGSSLIFNKKFLKKFTFCINCHDAELPNFRGMQANGLELYHNKLYTYFSWHFITKKIDGGYTFYKEKIKIKKKIIHNLFYEIKKVMVSSKRIEKILSLAVKSSKYKFSTSKKGNYYSLKYYKNLFNNLENFSFKEIEKYLEIFGGIIYSGELITKVKKSKDGISLKDCKIKIIEVKYLPITIYKFFKFFKLIRLT